MVVVGCPVIENYFQPDSRLTADSSHSRGINCSFCRQRVDCLICLNKAFCPQRFRQHRFMSSARVRRARPPGSTRPGSSAASRRRAGRSVPIPERTPLLLHFP